MPIIEYVSFELALTVVGKIVPFNVEVKFITS